MSTNIPVAQRSADALVIGGGIMGASIAWHLGRIGVRGVCVLERSTVAAGATGKTGALLRQHYSNVPEALLALRSLEVFQNWGEIVGGDCGHVPTGLVVTVDMGSGLEINAEHMRANVAMQNSLGIASHVITAEELQRLQPFARVDDLLIAAYEPSSGYVDSIASARTMATAAIREGATIQEGCDVLRLVERGGKISGVETPAGVLNCDTVIVAAGPWSTQLLSSVGVSVPISTLRVQVAIVQRPLAIDEPHFVFIDTAAGMFCRPWGPGRTLIGVGGGEQHDEVDPNAYDERNDLGYPARAIAIAARRIPAMSAASYLHGHAGLYDMTPDTHPIIGTTPIEGLYIAAGFSGAGFKKGPAVGESLAQLITGSEAAVDLSPFRLERFATAEWEKPWSDTEYVFTNDFGHKF